MYGDDEFLGGEPSLEDRWKALPPDAPIDLNDRDGVDGMLGAPITRWRDMGDEDAPAAWDELRSFVDWLVGRYEIPSNLIPACWFLHGPVVEELSALRAAWDASFVVDTDGGLGPIGWHERFALVRVRLREAYRGDCSRGGHVEAPESSVNVDEDEWEKRRRKA